MVCSSLFRRVTADRFWTEGAIHVSAYDSSSYTAWQIGGLERAHWVSVITGASHERIRNAQASIWGFLWRNLYLAYLEGVSSIRLLVRASLGRQSWSLHFAKWLRQQNFVASLQHYKMQFVGFLFFSISIEMEVGGQECLVLLHQAIKWPHFIYNN